MRFGGAFPFSKPAIPIHLFSGHTWPIAPGNFDITTGRVIILQTFDKDNYVWRTLAGPGRKFTVTDSDGFNYRLVNFSGIVSGALITTAGTAGTNGIGGTQTGCTISFGSAPSSGRAATGYVIVGGSINTTVTVTAAGTGYLVPPLIQFDAPPAGGIRATGYAILSGTTIGSIVVTNAGAGYTAVPSAYVIPQWGGYAGSNLVDPAGNTVATAPSLYGATVTTIPATIQDVGFQSVGAGSGAILTVNATLGGSGTTTGIVITDYGSNYTGTTIPTITFTGGPTSAAATAIMAFSVTSVTTGTAGNPSAVAPGWQSSGGLIAASDGNSGYYNITPAYGITALVGTTIASTIVESPGFGLQKVPVVTYGTAGGTILTTNPAGTAVCGGIADTAILQPGA